MFQNYFEIIVLPHMIYVLRGLYKFLDSIKFHFDLQCHCNSSLTFQRETVQYSNYENSSFLKKHLLQLASCPPLNCANVLVTAIWSSTFLLWFVLFLDDVTDSNFSSIPADDLLQVRSGMTLHTCLIAMLAKDYTHEIWIVWTQTVSN